MRVAFLALLLAILCAAIFVQATNSNPTPNDPTPFNKRSTKKEKFDVTGIVSGQDTVIINNGNKIKNKEQFILNLGPKISTAVDLALAGKVTIT